MPLWKDVVVDADEYSNWNNDSSPCLNLIEKNQSIYTSIDNLIPYPIIKILEVRSPKLYAKFLLKKEQYHHPNILQLFHDTEVPNVGSIMVSNLDWRRVVRAKYGKGVSFATTAAYANRYSNGFNTQKAMIIADVLVENISYHSGRDFPRDFIDTTKSADGNVIVKYCDDEFFPKYVVIYNGPKKQSKYSPRHHYDWDDYYDDNDNYDNFDYDSD